MMRILLAGAAAIALAASGAYAQPGNGKGNGNQGGKGEPAAKMERGKPDRGPQRADNGNNRGRADVRAERRQDRRVDRRVEQRAERREDRQQSERRAERREDRREAERRVERRQERRADRRDDRRDRNYIDRVRYERDQAFLGRDRSRGLIDGCPPGLAKKRNGCLPPGQAKKRDNRWNGYDYRPRLFGLSNYGSGRYFYNDGYLLRLGGNGGVSGYIPLLGGALAIGNPWPTNYNSYAVPDYYVDYFDLGPVSSYRYADNVIYRVDPGDAAIMSVAALLTGDQFTVGQRVPMGYDVYNVPYAYRDRYYDTPDAMYRYSDGYVYRIDPTTQLVAAAIDLLI